MTDTSPEFVLAVQVAGGLVICWFTGYGAGYVVRTLRRLMGKGAR